MKNDIFARQFDELFEEADDIAASSKISAEPGFTGRSFVDNNLLIGWRVKVKNCLQNIGGDKLPHLLAFNTHEESTIAETNSSIFKRQRAVFRNCSPGLVA